ncbi:hypothetical protein WN51_10089 [Melipona quadrifasciata]|uniref:Uncharacterized protein n=1 Tax=Melipona quadrifasciata TaxID=166423 RepID=A0A0N0BJK4_9HYME|nr:hypothetical protein WN51_10089 [Melipona quadrifasciata]
MPVLRKKSSKKVNAENGSGNLIGDITIDDFANSSRTHGRFKKAMINVSSEGYLCQYISINLVLCHFYYLCCVKSPLFL